MNEYLLIDAFCNLSLAVAGLVFLLPFILGVVKRNPWYGVRSAKTFSSSAIWRSVNRQTAIQFLGVLAPAFLVGGAMAFVGLNYQVPDNPFNYLWFVPLCLVGPVALQVLLKKLVWKKLLTPASAHSPFVYPYRRRAAREK